MMASVSELLIGVDHFSRECTFIVSLRIYSDIASEGSSIVL